MEIDIIHNDQEHDAAIAEIERLWNAEPGTPDADRLTLLGIVVAAYEDKHWPIEPMEPITFLKAHMENAGHTQADLAKLVGPSRASELLSRKRALTLDMIRRITKAWHIPAELLIAEYPLTGKAA